MLVEVLHQAVSFCLTEVQYPIVARVSAYCFSNCLTILMDNGIGNSMLVEEPRQADLFWPERSTSPYRSAPQRLLLLELLKKLMELPTVLEIVCYLRSRVRQKFVGQKKVQYPIVARVSVCCLSNCFEQKIELPKVLGIV